jgi:hypothetical protein
MPIAPLTMSAGGSSSGPGSVTDIQILNSLELTTDSLNAAFGSTNSWQDWSPDSTDKENIGYTGFLKCKAGLDSTGVTQPPAVTYFKADSLATDTSTPSSGATTPSTKSSKKKGGSPSSTSTSASSNGEPKHWVISVAAVFKDAATAKAAAQGVGKVDTSNSSLCGLPTSASTPPLPTYIGGQIGETEPTWYGEDPTVGFAVTKTNAALTAVAQQRGRFVIVTVTAGTGSLNSNYYSLNSSSDTDTAAEAATALLSQLTNAVVNAS